MRRVSRSSKAGGCDEDASRRREPAPRSASAVPAHLLRDNWPEIVLPARFERFSQWATCRSAFLRGSYPRSHSDESGQLIHETLSNSSVVRDPEVVSRRRVSTSAAAVCEAGGVRDRGTDSRPKTAGPGSVAEDRRRLAAGLKMVTASENLTPAAHRRTAHLAAGKDKVHAAQLRAPPGWGLVAVEVHPG